MKKGKKKRKVRSTQKLADLPKAYLDVLTVFEAFRRLGIAADDIWLVFGHVLNVGDDTLYVQARQGELEFNYTVTQLRGATRETVQANWQLAAELWNSSPEEETRPIWEASEVKAQAGELVARMYAKGFRFPDRSAN